MLIMMKGLPGCGKTTAARALQKDFDDLFVVSRDELRSMMTGSPKKSASMGPDIEKGISSAMTSLAKNSLVAKKKVIVDATNLREGDEKHWRKIASEVGVEFVVHDMTNVPLEECKKRNRYREHPIPEGEIERMAKFAGLDK